MKLNQTGQFLALFAAMLFAAPGFLAQEEYCSSDGGNGYYDIYSIAFGDAVFNASGDDDGYGDYTDVLVDAEAGQNLTLSLQAGGPWWQRYYWRVWVDFDNDGSFDGDLQDEVNGYFTQYATIHVPADFNEHARIRVNVSLHQYRGACAHYDSGEVEDYTLNAGASCTADAGTLSTAEGSVCFDGSATLTAAPNGDAVVPEGFSTLFVLTEGAGLVIENAGSEPSFTVTEEGNYTIHTLVYDPATLDLGIVELGVTTGFDVFELITDGGGSICASLDVPGAAFHVSEDACPEPCATIVGLQFSNGDESVVLENGGSYSLTDLPAGFYTEIITDGAVGSALIAVEGDGGADFSIENFFPYTYPGGNEPWELGEGSYTVSASLFSFSHLNGDLCDEALFNFTLEACSAAAGTMTADADAVCFDGTTMISATANGDAIVPEGFSNIYVLTQGEGLTIVNAGGEPAFEVTEAGNYTIHSLVYNPETLDLGIIEFGVTTGFDVFGLITEGGGSICASLDVPGAPIAVEAPMAGTLSGGGEACLVDGATTLTAMPNGDANVPDGYSSIFVLTQGAGLTIVNAGAEPSFEVTETGVFTIHTLVYNPATLDLGIIDFGTTSGVDVLGLISEGGGAICASLDVPGAPFNVAECACDAEAGTLTADADAVCYAYYGAQISATANGDAVVPAGFSNIYVLTQGEGLVIVNAGGEPSFEVTEAGNYTIHSLVYNPETLDLGIIEFGVTTGFDVFGLINAGGGDICASLDVAGAPVAVENPQAGNLYPESFVYCIEQGESTTIAANTAGNAIVPEGYETLFVLTRAWDLTILDVNTVPEFQVDTWNFYRIHTLVYNPATLDLSIVELGTTTGLDVFGLLTAGGGDICGSLDVGGALILVWKPWICDLFGGFHSSLIVETEQEQLEKWMADAGSVEQLERVLIEASALVDVYPNPATDMANVRVAGFAADQLIQIDLLDVTGRVVMATAWNVGTNDRFEMDFAAQGAGQYHLVLTQGDVRIHRKVLVVR